MPGMSHPSSPIKLPLGRTIFVGVVVPAFFVWLNDRLLTQFSITETFWTSLQLLIVCVVQVGAFGLLCGKLIEWPVLRWLIYGWCWLLVDMQFLSAAWLAGRDSFLLTNGMFGAQIGLITIWAILGTTRWVFRLPIALVLVTLLSLPLAMSGGWYYYYSNIEYLFAIQTLALAALCGLLRWNGYRLLPLEATPVADAEQRTSQFGVRHLLVWTTALAIALAAARSFEVLSPRMLAGFRYNGWDWGLLLTQGLLLAIVLIVALWAALGQGSAWLRWSLLVVSALSTGFLAAFLQYQADKRAGRFFLAFFDWRAFWDWYQNWIAVFVLAASLLFATLLIVRVRGYRLQRLTK